MDQTFSIAGAREYIAGRRPKLLRTFDDLSQFLGIRATTQAGPVLYLTLASEFVLISTNRIQLAVDNGELDNFSAIAYALSQSSPPTTGVFVDAYPHLPYPLNTIAGSLSRFAEKDLKAVPNAAMLLRLCLRSDSGERAAAYLNLFAEMITNSPGTISEFLTSFDKLKKKHSPTFLDEWLRRGADLISSGRTDEGVRYLLGQSRESRNHLGISSAVLDDVKQVLQIYCTSVANHPMAVTRLTTSTFGIGYPYTDGKTIFLPSGLGYFETIEDNENAYSAVAALQAAQIELGTYSFAEAGIPFQAELQTRYGLVLPDVMEHVTKQYEDRSTAIRERSTGETEVVFSGQRVIEILETPHEKFFYRFPTPDLIRELFSLLESFRIETNLSARYSGLRDDFARLNRKLMDLRPTVVSAAGGSFVQAINLLINMTLQPLPTGWADRRAAANSTGQNTGTSGRYVVVDRAYREALILLSRPNTSVYDTALAAFNVYNALYDTYQIIPWCRRNDIRSLFSAGVKSTLQPEIVLDVSPELFPGAGEKQTPAALEEQEVQDIDLTSFTKTERKASQLREAILNGEVRIFRYPEYDAAKARFLPKHCTLYESVLDEEDSDFYRQTLKDHDRTFRRLRKRFLMMQPEELELSRRWLVGDEIHIGDAFDFATDLLRGTAPDGKIYQRRKRNRRDIVAGVLLDSSSSTEAEVDGEAIISVEKKALCLLAGVLDPIGDSFGIFSYFSMGRHNNFYMVAKDFHEKWNNQTQARIPGIGAHSSNRDGCAIRHTTARLLEQPEKTKLLLLLSDGIPADAGYGAADGSETNSYAIEDTRRAIVEARIAGVVPYCITIDKSAKAYIPRLYGDYHYSVIRTVAELPEKLSRLYLRLTR